MTQQPYYQPQYPQQPPAQQGPPEWAQPQQPWTPPGQPMQQAYQQPYAPAAPPAQPLANGGIDEFYSQPNLGGGPGVSWKGKPDGYTVQGIVPRDTGDGDVSQEVGAPGSPDAGRPLTYRDGRPKFVLAVPLQVAPSQEFPDGEARLYVRGQLRDELARAMAEVGCSGAPTAGAVITVTLVQRKQGRGTIPQNVFAVQYTPPGGAAPQIQQPVQQPQYAQPQPVQQYAPQAQPVQQFQPPQQAPQPVQGQQYAQPQYQAPAPQQAAPMQAQPQPPAGLTPEQELLLSQLNAAKQAG